MVKKKVMKKKTDKTINILTHILALFTGFLGPLIIFLASEDKIAKKHAKYALNWQFSLMIYIFVSIPLVFILIGIPLLIAIGVLNTIFCIIATVKASENTFWKYPLAIPFFKVK